MKDLSSQGPRVCKVNSPKKAQLAGTLPVFTSLCPVTLSLVSAWLQGQGLCSTGQHPLGSFSAQPSSGGGAVNALNHSVIRVLGEPWV